MILGVGDGGEHWTGGRTDGLTFYIFKDKCGRCHQGKKVEDGWFAGQPDGADSCNRPLSAVVGTVKWRENLATVAYRLNGLFLCIMYITGDCTYVWH